MRVSYRHLALSLLGPVISASFLPPSTGITLLHPLSLQHPPLARVKQTFSYTFPSDTFSSSSSLNYTALNIPPWLSFSSANRSFYGLPAENNIGYYPIAVTATSSDGQYNTEDTITFAVSERIPVNITYPLVDQLVTNDTAITSAFPYQPGANNYPGVRVPPDWSFSLGFQPYTYTAASKVYYSATMADGSPLLPWLDFNNATVTFDGITPAQTPGIPAIYQIAVWGSDVSGFADVQQTFNICIAAHDLEQVQTPILNVTEGYSVNASLADALYAFTIDGNQLFSTQLVNVTVDLARQNWLSYSSGNMSFTGSPPSSLVAGQNVQLPLYITDKWSDSINSSLQIAFYPSHFSAQSIDPVLAAPSQFISVPLSTYIIESGGANVTSTFNPSKSSSWLSFMSSNLSLTGTIPSNVDYDSVLVTLHAVDNVTHALSHSEILISLAPNGTTNVVHQHHGLGTGPKVAIGVISSVAACLVLICLLVILCRRSKRRSYIRDNPSAEDSEADDKWATFEYKAETPAMEFCEKMPEPPSAQTLVGRTEYEIPVSVMSSLPQLSSGMGTNSRGKKKGVLRNPFKGKVRPKISNPIIMPSFSNAAFQAQLAAAVDSAGILKRKSMYVPHDKADNDKSTTHSGTDFTESYVDGSRDGARLAASGRSVTDGTSSRFEGHSSRASWESEPPFAWTGNDHHGATSDATRSEETHDISDISSASGTGLGIVAVQRSDFRPAAALSALGVRHDVVTPGSSGSEEAISIDNIHFPTDSDIANTTASSEPELAAVIHTASRVDARRTLDSPVSTASPASTVTEKASRGPSPVMTTHSRLVSLGNKRMVLVKQDGGRSVSQTAVVGNQFESASASSGSGSRIAAASSNRTNSPASVRSSIRSIDSTPRAGATIPDSPLPPPPPMHPHSRSSTPPSSLPSLPALPSLPSPQVSSNAPQRILLGVSEPFHFYPPLALSPSSSQSSSAAASSTDSQPSGRPGTDGAEYSAYVEEGGNLGPLPAWLRFEGMELWGVPGEGDRGVWGIKIVERKGEEDERVVGSFWLEVVGRS